MRRDEDMQVKVPIKRFGRTEIQMPVLTCGGMRYQQSWQDIEPDTVDPKGQENLEACIHRALELGINHIETARGYGSSEMQLGRVLPKFDRDRLLVQTKIHPWEFPNRTLTQVFEQCTNNLQLDHVDFLSLHGLNTPELLAPAGLFPKGGRCRLCVPPHRCTADPVRGVRVEDAEREARWQQS